MEHFLTMLFLIFKNKNVNTLTTLQVVAQTDGGLSVHDLPTEYKVKKKRRGFYVWLNESILNEKTDF